MTSTVTITPLINIKDFAVVDNSLVSRKSFDSHKDELTFFHEASGKSRTDTLINVSLYEDLLVLENVHYKILSMFSK